MACTPFPLRVSGRAGQAGWVRTAMHASFVASGYIRFGSEPRPFQWLVSRQKSPGLSPDGIYREQLGCH